MTCKCGSDRIASINSKARDLHFVDIPHLAIEHDGYLPDIGIGSGDYVEFDFCLDCGQIQAFAPITDEAIMSMEEFGGCGEDADEDTKAEWAEEQAKEAKLDAAEVSVFSMKDVEKNRVKGLMFNSYGPQWKENEEAIEILQGTIDDPKCGKPLRQAILELLK